MSKFQEYLSFRHLKDALKDAYSFSGMDYGLQEGNRVLILWDGQVKADVLTELVKRIQATVKDDKLCQVENSQQLGKCECRTLGGK